jgi:tRNA dimethylallyltransferase
MQKTAIIINGPTAVGKTDLAIQLAQYFNTEIISSDSRQCYRELNVGVAKPNAAQLAAVPHHFINSHSIHQEVNAASFENYALGCADKIFANHNVLILVGGTGLYTKAFCDGLDNIPSIPPSLKADILQRYETGGDEWLREEIEKEDPKFYLSGEIQNPRRILRALEVKMATGKSIRDFQTREKSKRNFLTIQIGLEITRQLLYERINN